MIVTHPFEPVYNNESKILILGSFPSVKSREINFYYGHPQNRFWKILENIFNEKIENNKEIKKEFLLKHHIALWDTIKSCQITSSSDSSIKKATPNNIDKINKYIDNFIIINATERKNICKLDVYSNNGFTGDCKLKYDNNIRKFVEV